MKLIWTLFITFFLSSPLVLAETVDFTSDFTSGKNCVKSAVYPAFVHRWGEEKKVKVCMDKKTYTETKGKLYICNDEEDETVPKLLMKYTVKKHVITERQAYYKDVDKKESTLDQVLPRKCFALDIEIPKEEGTYAFIIDGKTYPKMSAKITFNVGVIDTEERKEEVKKAEEQINMATNPKFEQVEITNNECKKIMTSFKNRFSELKGVNEDDFCNSYTLSKHALIFSSATNNFIIVPVKYTSEIKFTSAAEVAIDATATKFDQQKAEKFIQGSKPDADKWKGMIKLFCKSPSNSWDRQGIYCIRDVGTGFVSDPEQPTYYVYVSIPKSTWIGYAESIGIEEVKVEIGIWKPGCVGVKLEDSKTTLATDDTHCSEAGKIEEYKYLFGPKVAENIPVGKAEREKPQTFTVPKNIVNTLFGGKTTFENALNTIRTDCKFVKEEGTNYQYSCTGATTTDGTCTANIKNSIKDRDSACTNKGEIAGANNQYLCSNVCSGEIERDTHTLHDIPCRDITEGVQLEGYKCTSGKWVKPTEQPSTQEKAPTPETKLAACKDKNMVNTDNAITEDCQCGQKTDLKSGWCCMQTPGEYFASSSSCKDYWKISTTKCVEGKITQPCWCGTYPTSGRSYDDGYCYSGQWSAIEQASVVTKTFLKSSDTCKKSDGTLVTPTSIDVAKNALGTPEAACKCYVPYWDERGPCNVPTECSTWFNSDCTVKS